MTFRRKPLHITPADSPSADDSTDIKVENALKKKLLWPFKNASRTIAFLSTVGLLCTWGWGQAKAKFTEEAHTETQALRNEVIPRVDRIETKVDTLIDFMGAPRPTTRP